MCCVNPSNKVKCVKSLANSYKNLESIQLTELKGVGDKLAANLCKLGIETVQDLLFHLPRQYLDKTRITPISKLRFGFSAVIQGRILKNDIKFGRRRSLAVALEDESGTIILRFFHFNAAQKNRLAPGTLLRCYGEARLGSSGLELYHPEYEFPEESKAQELEQSLTPIYSLTEGVTQLRLRNLSEQALGLLEKHPPVDYLPKAFVKHFGDTSLTDALRYLHKPPVGAPVNMLLAGEHPFQKRLAFEELLVHFLARQRLREHVQQETAAKIVISKENEQHFLQQFSFSLTGAQKKVCTEIYRDLAQAHPMMRMLQGDVGAGKTLVAALAALQVVNAGRQVAMVAPTEILAEQHFNNFAQWFTQHNISVHLLVSKLKAKQKRETLQAITDGSAQIIIGTHALFQDQVEFNLPGLIIIDEQHRFGVEQRKRLREKSPTNEVPHQLIMTATPIPRTLAMTAYSEMDYSILDELPPGRTPVETLVISQQRRYELIERIRSACTEGKQAYWVCTLIENSETLSAANAEEICEQLKLALPDVKVGLVHGKQKPAEKEAQMQAFKRGEMQLLVATTVIEVGVDVPNASLMIIENPERLGLAQLHQLRGRVGRGSIASFCVLLYGDKLSEQAKQRLQVMRQTSDGFLIAEKDLELRGPGELLGTRQTGDMTYLVADLQRDAHLLPHIHSCGKMLLETRPDAVDKLLDRWLGKNQEYARV